MGEQRRADLGGERSGVDDAARALGDEMPGGDLVGQEYAARIDGEIEVPVRVGQLERALHGRDAGVGDTGCRSRRDGESASPNARSTDARSRTSTSTATAPAPISVRRSPGRLEIDIGDRHLRRRFARAHAAIARPMPCAPPVTKARLPLSSE